MASPGSSQLLAERRSFTAPVVPDAQIVLGMLPKTHKTYWNKYKDEIVNLGRWYGGEATLGLAVPDYVEAQSIEDLSEYRSEFGGEIVGIEPGSGIMRITKK